LPKNCVFLGVCRQKNVKVCPMEIYPQLYREIKSFVYRRVKNLQDSEDIVQDVFIKAQLKSAQLKESEKFTAWMYSMTRNSIIDHFRSRQRTFDAATLEASQSDYNEFNDCVVDCIGQLIHTLPSPYREALELADKQQVPQKELAERLGISYSGAKSRVQRARLMLKEKMEKLYKIETDGFGNVLVCEDRLPCGCNN
jgi:RNA polymerase sigma-70 factor (ECF subfamily)